jgi:hypothetical protein
MLLVLLSNSIIPSYYSYKLKLVNAKTYIIELTQVDRKLKPIMQHPSEYRCFKRNWKLRRANRSDTDCSCRNRDKKGGSLRMIRGIFWSNCSNYRKWVKSCRHRIRNYRNRNNIYWSRYNFYRGLTMIKRQEIFNHIDKKYSTHKSKSTNKSYNAIAQTEK